MNVTFFSLLNPLYINNVNVNEAQKHNGDPNIHLHYNNNTLLWIIIHNAMLYILHIYY